MHEFDMSLHHNIATKHSRRLIVLMAVDSLDDLQTAADESSTDLTVLRQYLRQYTYIDYRKTDWLDKLLYALPVNGMLMSCEEESDEDTKLLT